MYGAHTHSHLAAAHEARDDDGESEGARSRQHDEVGVRHRRLQIRARLGGAWLSERGDTVFDAKAAQRTDTVPLISMMGALATNQDHAWRRL